MSPCRSEAAATRAKARSCSFGIRFAEVSVRIRRSVSAWALPRPSATASAKFANKTVNHSQTVIWPENSAVIPIILPGPMTRSRRKKIVVSTDTISTQNITGFFASVRGLSLRNAAPIAGTSSARSRSLSCCCRLKSPACSG